MSCGTCGIQASNVLQDDTGVPAGAPVLRRTVAGSQGLTNQPWQLRTVLRWMPPEEGALVGPQAPVQPMPEGGLVCQVCGRLCQAQGYEVESATTGRVLVGPECGRNLLGGVAWREAQTAHQAAQAAERLRASEHEAAERLRAEVQSWQAAQPELWSFLQDALAEDPQSPFFGGVAERLRSAGGITAGQQEALAQAQRRGLAEVRRRRELRESDAVWSQALAYATTWMNLPYRDPSVGILQDMQRRSYKRWEAGQEVPVLSPKQRALLQRTLRRYARKRVWDLVERAPFSGGVQDSLFYSYMPFLVAALRADAETLEREPGPAQVEQLYRVAWVLQQAARRAAGQSFDLRVAATGAPVEAAGLPLTGVQVRGIRVTPESDWVLDLEVAPASQRVTVTVGEHMTVTEPGAVAG